MSDGPEQGTSEKRGTLSERLPSFIPRFHRKDPSLYQRGDDISEYVSRGPICTATFPSKHQDALDSIDQARSDVFQSLMMELDAIPRALAARARLVKEYADWKRDYIFATKCKSPAETLAMMCMERSISSSSTPASSPPESRKNRMEGVDVSALPAGFGKRRQPASGGASLKKPKTPSASTPELVSPAPPSEQPDGSPEIS